jgi:hypothetical protein
MLRERSRRFRYEDWGWQGDKLQCSYSLDDRRFTERITFEGAAASSDPRLRAASRLVFLLAGISYYKAGAPPVIDLGTHAVSATEREFLHTYYRKGLGEFAYKNGLLRELNDVVIVGPAREPVAGSGRPGTLGGRTQDAVPAGSPSARPLIPFGGGIDSIVVVDEVTRQHGDVALFVAGRAGARFEPIEKAAALTGLPVRRADRDLDPQILRSAELRLLNGHVPVTGILSSMAVVAAIVDGRDRVIMSNEWSASSATLEVDGVTVNHQWSKSMEFEAAFRGVLADSLSGLEYYSALRPFSELWVARRFAELPRYHLAFRSCNRAFHLDPASRYERWCGRCDKCCFVDLILSPFLDRDRLVQIFDGREPLDQADLEWRFRSLLGDPARAKPFECVGDVDECRVALMMAAARPDRQGNAMLQALAAEIGGSSTMPAPEDLLRPLGASFIPQPT